MKRNYKSLLAGCGQVGSRHLQAIASLPDIDEIHIVDPSDSSLELGKSRLAEISDLNKAIKFYWHREFNNAVQNGDLCIISTQAKDRSELLKSVAREYGYKFFLIEKIVTQSVRSYQDLIQFCDENKLSVWVNCKTRTYSIHKYIKSKIDPNKPIIFSDFGGNHGLANNGVHSADLFIYYDEAKEIKPFGSIVDPALHRSKRGKDIFDLSGTLCGFTDKGSNFMLSFMDNSDIPDCISIVNARCRFIVDHFQKFAFESYPETNWQWQLIPIDENWAVSHMSKRFVSDILLNANCELPTLRDCFPAHKFILNQTLPHFNRMLNVERDFCPVT